MYSPDYQYLPKHIGGGDKVHKLLVKRLKRYFNSFTNGFPGKHWCMLITTAGITLYPMLSHIGNGWPDNRLLLFIAAYTFAYALTLLGHLVRLRFLRIAVYAIGYFLTITHCILQTACINVVENILDKDLVAALLATNSGEASEFLNSYFNAYVVAILAGLIPYTALLWWAGKRLGKTVHAKTSRILAVAFVAGACITIPNYWIYRYTAVGFTRNIIQIVSEPSTEKLHHTNVTVTVTSANQPPVIVWIIGESLTSHHCSLYGYDKNTNPLLQKKVDNGEALLFTHVQAAGLYTQASFQLMMGTYSKDMGNKKKWSDCPTVPDIAKAAGYQTLWISNQSKKGLYDNAVGQYSELCDTSIFIGNKFAGVQRTSVDGALLPVVKNVISLPYDRKLIIVHLMGCHNMFNMRYPASFAKFKDSDYANHPQAQREKLSTYDNAVLYNDYVVDALMNLVANREAVVMYSPDHGLDVFESNPNVASHGNPNNPISSKAGHDIPFLIYATKTYSQRHPDIMERMKRSINRHFDMEDAPYLMMDLMQCDFKNHDVTRKSLLRKMN